MDIVGRIKGILMDPKAEWPAIEREPADAGSLFTNYVMYVAAIPPIATFIGHSIIGIGPYRVGIFGGLIYAIITYVLMLVGVYVMAFVIDFLAGVFGGRKDFANAMRVASYAPTAAWVAGIFNIIPYLGFLTILGLYSLYLLHTGIAALMKPPADKALIYTIAAIVCIIIVWFVIVMIPVALLGAGMMMS